MYTLLSIIMIVFAILQIILFFKIWGMTNNVEKIAQKLKCDLEPAVCIRQALLKGDKEKAAELLTDALTQELAEYSVGYTDGYGSVDEIKEKYKKLFKRIGIDELPITKVENVKDIRGIMPYFRLKR